MNHERGSVELWNDTERLASKSWEEKRNTSQDILQALETIRMEKNIAWSDVPKLSLELELSPHATARRIAETFEKTYTTFVA